MGFLAVGINHTTASVDVRERVAFAPDQLADALQQLRDDTSSREVAILSTCNRTEIYCTQDHMDPDRLIEWVARYHGLETQAVAQCSYIHQDAGAVSHMMRVAAGLDSMVLGEPQILGQMKEAVRAAEAAGSLGTLLHQLFQRTFSVAKEVRSTTAIGAHSVSMAAAAVKLAERVFGDLSECNTLFIGAGEMIELCATHFAAVRPRQMVVANRTVERAETLANRFNARSMKLADLPDRIAEFDVIVSCTASSLPILGLGMVERATRSRRHRPMVMVDLAVPRDIEHEVGRLADIYLYTVDDLGRLVQSGADARKAAVVQAEAIIETRVQKFMHWLQSREAVPTIIELQRTADHIQQQELEKAQRLLARGEDPARVLEILAHGLTQKYLHGPMATLNQSEPEERAQLLSLLPRLMPTAEKRR